MKKKIITPVIVNNLSISIPKKDREQRLINFTLEQIRQETSFQDGGSPLVTRSPD